MSNCVFNFNILALVIRGPYAPLLCLMTFYTRGPYAPMSNSGFNFNILALVVSEILEGPNLR